jgi:hypothetical protein
MDGLKERYDVLTWLVIAIICFAAGSTPGLEPADPP